MSSHPAFSHFTPAPRSVPTQPACCPPMTTPIRMTATSPTPTTTASSYSTLIRSLSTFSSPSSPSPNSNSTSREHTFEFLTWPQVEALGMSLTQQIRHSGDQFDVILAVTRGGLIPATLLCQSLQLRNILTTTVIFYTDEGSQFFGMTEPRFLSFPSAHSLKDRRVLIVDDVWDSGRTACAVRDRVSRAQPKSVKIAVLHFKPKQSIFGEAGPEFCGCETDNWLVYPWEAMSPSSPSCEQNSDTLEVGDDVDVSISHRDESNKTVASGNGSSPTPESSSVEQSPRR